MIGKKMLLSSGMLLLSTLSVTSIISCSTENKYSLNDIGGLNDEFNPNKKVNDALVNVVNKINLGSDEKRKKILEQKTILLTTGGVVSDQSFNQSVWEALSKFSMEIGNPNNSFFETKSISEAAQSDAYDYALAKGYKVWILTGFQQGNLLKTWLKIGKNKEAFREAGVRVITVDWFADPEMEELTPPGSILGLNFETQQASFVAAYAAAKLLKEINFEDKTKFKNQYFDTFGGGDFSGVTNFNYGFMEGIRQFNEDLYEFNKTLTDDKDATNDNLIHKFYVSPSTDKIDLTTGFGPTVEARSKVEIQVDTNKPQVVFPVAGSLTANAIDFIKAKKSGQWVIGVDTNQALAFPNDKGMLLTSVEKRISIAIYKALATIYGVSNFDQDKMKTFLPTGYSFDIETGYLKFGNEFKNCDVKKGYADSFVGTSKSTLSEDFKFKNGKTYAQRYDEIVAETWDEFFGSKTKQGRLNIDTNQKEDFIGFDGKLTQKKGLKPTKEIIANFNASISAEWPDEKEENYQEKRQKIIDDVLALKNVLIGYMTAGNEKNYFNPIMKKIKDWVEAEWKK